MRAYLYFQQKMMKHGPRTQKTTKITLGTVDGRNPAPVDMVNIPLFTRFYTSQVVVWDF